MPDVEIVTVIQERLDNSTLTVRYRGKVIGTVLRDGQHTWLATVPPMPSDGQTEVKSLTAAVDWLIKRSAQDPHASL